jgi:uncharacterized protein YodC (DUF2158 family)
MMELKPGDIVMLKSGGQAMTVAEVDGDAVLCVWMGEDGELFRESLPVAVLDAIEVDVGDDEDDELSEATKVA